MESGQTVSVVLGMRALDCELSIAAGPSGSQVVLDKGGPVALPVKLRIATGQHRLTLTAVAHETRTEDLTCDGYTPIDIRSAWTPAALLAAPLSTRQVKSKPTRRRWLWAVVGGSAGIVVAGVVVGAVLGTRPHDPTPTVGTASLGLRQ